MLYRQNRVGKGGEDFPLYKFATTPATMIHRNLNVIRYFKGLPAPPDELFEVLSEEQQRALSSAIRGTA